MLLSGRRDERESHRCRYLKIRLRLCDSRIIHTHKCYRTACSMQSSSDQLNNFLRRISPVFIALGDWLSRFTGHHTMTYSCCTTIPCWRLNLSHQPHASPKSELALTARSNHPRAFSILQSAQLSNCTNHEWVSLTFPEGDHTACLA